MKIIILVALFSIISLSCNVSMPMPPSEKLANQWFESNFTRCGEGTYTRYKGKKLVVDPTVNRRLMSNYANTELSSAGPDAMVANTVIQINNPSPAVEQSNVSETSRLNGVEFDGYVIITPKNFSFRYWDLENTRKGWSEWREGPILVAPDLTDTLLQLGAKYRGSATLPPKTPFRNSIFKAINKDWQEPQSNGLSKPDCAEIPFS